jgi:Protein of unknown function (DUF1566)
MNTSLQSLIRAAALAFISAVWPLTMQDAHALCRNDLKSDTPTNRFVVNVNGTVLDTKTQMLWKQCIEGLSGVNCADGTAIFFTWKSAFDHSAVISFGGFNDWRVPNIKELESIVERSCFNPSINERIFPNTPSNVYWSSSPNAGNATTYSRVVYFTDGFDNGSFSKYSVANLRLVRGGQ